MKKISFSELINIDSLRKMAENLYEATGIVFAVLDPEGTIIISTGWQDICTKFHRVHPVTCKRCCISDRYICEHIMEGGYIAYKCENNIWDIAAPVIIAGEHVATIFFGQFFYEDEEIDIEYFRAQALEFGFNEEEYLEALKRVPVFSKKKVEHIMEYYLGLVMALAESGLRQLEFKSSQKELERSEKYLDTIFNSVRDAILISDTFGNIIDINESASNMFGYTYNEFKSMNIKDIISQDSNLMWVDISKLTDNMKGKNPLIEELIGKNKNNIEFWIEFNMYAIEVGQDEKIVTVVRDISQRKQAELMQRNEDIELEKLRTEFFANISHELRTPLNIILGTMQIIEMTIKDEKKSLDKEKIINNLNIQRQNCFRLIRLVNNLIDSTKLDSGYYELNMENCNIVNIVEEITLSVAEYVSNNNLSLIFDTDIEEKIVACDPDKIERIILNLLSNSVKFTPDGGSIFVNILDGEEYITISIKDNGIGIAEDKISVIFDRFRQVDKSFTRKYEGSGIGLSLVKSLVEMQGGTISVESKYGVGTEFIIRFPVNKINYYKNEEGPKFVDSKIFNYVEKIKVEFSDIYK